MSTNCYRCEIAAECAALPHGVLDCQDNAARFDAPTLPPCPWTFRGSIDCAQYGPRDCDGVRCAGQTPAERLTLGQYARALVKASPHRTKAVRDSDDAKMRVYERLLDSERGATPEPVPDPAGALSMVAQAVAEWRDNEGPDVDSSDFIQAIEDAMDWHHIAIPEISRRPFEDCDKPCSVECDRMTCTRDAEGSAE